MTVRLTTLYRHSGRIEVEEFGGHAAAYMHLLNPEVAVPDLVVIQELDAPEPSTWGQVMDGDEVVAPDSSPWMVEASLRSPDGQVMPRGTVVLFRTAELGGRHELQFDVTPDMPIMRRPGVLSAAAQLLHDVGLWSGR